MFSASLLYHVTIATAWSSSEVFTVNANKKNITSWYGLLSQKQGAYLFSRCNTQLPDMDSSHMHDEETLTSSRQCVVILFVYCVCTVAIPYNTLYTIHYTLYTICYTQYTIQNNQHTIHCTQNTIQNTKSTIHCALYKIQNKQTIHCTQYTIQNT
jgi:hypothetical protein